MNTSPLKPISDISHDGVPLQEILDNHRKWRRNEGGQRATLVKANLQSADLRDIDLVGADLLLSKMDKSDLSGAILRDAHLVKASLNDCDLQFADLTGADLSGSRLSRSDLFGATLWRAKLDYAVIDCAILRDVTLRDCSLINADLSGADLSGVHLDNANLSGWIIKGVSCTHLYRKASGGEEKIEFGPAEFEKRYTIVQQLVEIVLRVPLSIAASHVAQIICKSINEVSRATMVGIKGIEAISNIDTKVTFVVFDEVFFRSMQWKSKALSDRLNGFLEKESIVTNHSEIDDPIQHASGGVLRLRNIPLPLVPYEVDSKIIHQRIIEFYNGLGRIGEVIYLSLIHI